MVSRFKITPVKLSNGIIVNEILLKKIVTKLKKCKNVEISYNEHSVCFEYLTPSGKGKYILNDITLYVNNIDIPSTGLLEIYATTV